jgi:hypothetical protein
MVLEIKDLGRMFESLEEYFQREQIEIWLFNNKFYRKKEESYRYDITFVIVTLR